MALSADLASHISQRFRQKHKLLLCPNSRSEGDAQQMATELVNRFYFNHSALPAIALTADALILAYIDNDSAFQGCLFTAGRRLWRCKEISWFGSVQTAGLQLS